MLGVLPLVQGLALVEPLIALQTDKLVAERERQHLGEIGLADTGRPFDQDRLLERGSQIDHGRDPAAGDIFLTGKSLDYLFDRLKHSSSWALRMPAKGCRAVHVKYHEPPGL